MSDIINILPDNVANQIAAGEVVDRPASAVKELLENAIDAGATQVQLIVKDAGRTLIQVIDNGCGMSENDARLCFERHATSKVKKTDDLFCIQTMGFRGEALASIAAIAQVELKTRMHENELGTIVHIEGCKIQDQESCSCAAGTSISVKSLFYNVPARRNFLKKDSIELSHIEEVFRRVTLANCNVSFMFYSNGKLLYDLKSGNLSQRICQLFGESYRGKFYNIEESNDIVKVKGLVGKPEYARKTRGEQYLFVNNRFIKHPALSAAIEKAYMGLTPDRYYPSYFVNLQVDPARIDVNIHPTKTEVKFIDDHALFALLRATVKKALGQFNLATELDFDKPIEFDFSPAPKGVIPESPSITVDTSYNPFINSKTNSSTHSSSSSFGTKKTNQHNRWENFFEEEKKTATATDIPAESDSANNMIVNANFDNSQPAHTTPGSGCVIQLQNRWLVSAMPSGLLVVDQQRASERIQYDRFIRRKNMADKKQQEENKNMAGIQQLLFPVNLSFTPADAEMLGELLPDIRANGFAIENLGKNTFVVTGTPPDINDSELQDVFNQLLLDYKSSMMQKYYERNESICKTLARKTAVKNGQHLCIEEINQIIAELFSSASPQVTPDGKPTMKILSSEQINNLFN